MLASLLLAVAGSVSCMVLGGWLGYRVGIQQGEANTMNDLMDRCLEEPMPPFCAGLLQAIGQIGNNTKPAFGNEEERAP